MKMTRAQFVKFLASVRFGIAIRGPYDIRSCRCRDVNCHGWRLVARRQQPKKVA